MLSSKLSVNAVVIHNENREYSFLTGPNDRFAYGGFYAIFLLRGRKKCKCEESVWDVLTNLERSRLTTRIPWDKNINDLS